MFKKGEKIICVNDDFSHFKTDKEIPREYQDLILPELGKEYTVREVIDMEVDTAVRLVEIQNKKIHHDKGGLEEPAFALHRFSKKK